MCIDRLAPTQSTNDRRRAHLVPDQQEARLVGKTSEVALLALG